VARNPFNQSADQIFRKVRNHGTCTIPNFPATSPLLKFSTWVQFLNSFNLGRQGNSLSEDDSTESTASTASQNYDLPYRQRTFLALDCKGQSQPSICAATDLQFLNSKYHSFLMRPCSNSTPAYVLAFGNPINSRNAMILNLERLHGLKPREPPWQHS
jgi:hypothetical protein